MARARCIQRRRRDRAARHALSLLIAIVASATFYAASLRFPWLVRHVVVAGAVFGLGMYGVMNFIVVPLSAVPRPPASAPLTTITGLLVHMFLVGIPIALGARQASRRALAPTSD
jgi:hypothetical protein